MLWEELACLPPEIRHALGAWGPQLVSERLSRVSCSPRRRPHRHCQRPPLHHLRPNQQQGFHLERHNPFNEDQAETVSSSDTTPVHTSSQEKGESHTPDLPDTCTELEVIRSAGRGPEKLGERPGVPPGHS